MYIEKFNKYLFKLCQYGGTDNIDKMMLFENSYIHKSRDSDNILTYTISDKNYKIIEGANSITIEDFGEINIRRKCSDLLSGYFTKHKELSEDIKIILLDIAESLNLTFIESTIKIFEHSILFYEFAFIFLNPKHNLYELYNKALINYNEKIGISNEYYTEETKKYSINLLWIFRNKSNNCLSFINDIPYLFNTEDKIWNIIMTNESVQKLITWSRMNPAGQINFWIDSNLLDVHTIINMRIIFYIINSSNPHKIYLKDLHKLKTTEEINTTYKNVFNGQDGFITPVYFRVDLYKAIITLEELKIGMTYAIVLDMDMAPQPSEILFSEKTLKSLNDVGFVMAGGLRESYENGFQIFGSENPEINDIVIDSISKILIKMNIVLCNYLIFKKIISSDSDSSDIRMFSQIVYRLYIFMFKYIFYRLNKGYLLYRPCSKIDTPDFYFAVQSDEIIKITKDNEHIIFNDDQALSNSDITCSHINGRSYFIDYAYDSEFFKSKNEFTIEELNLHLDSIDDKLLIKTSFGMPLPPEHKLDVSSMMPRSALNFT